MSANLHSAIKLALRRRLLTVAALPTARHWENESFNRPAAVRWLRENYMPAGTTLRGLPAWYGSLVTEGLYLPALFEPTGVGTEGADAVAGAIAAAFPAALQIEATDPADGTTRLAVVTIVSASRVPALVEANWYQLPVRVRWTAESLNPLTPPLSEVA